MLDFLGNKAVRLGYWLTIHFYMLSQFINKHTAKLDGKLAMRYIKKGN